MFCTKCGNELNENMAFCSKCGAKVGEQENTSNEANVVVKSKKRVYL